MLIAFLLRPFVLVKVNAGHKAVPADAIEMTACEGARTSNFQETCTGQKQSKGTGQENWQIESRSLHTGSSGQLRTRNCRGVY